MSSSMNRFLSDEAIALHKEYLRQLKLRYSVIEKSIPEIKDKDMRALCKMRLGRERDEIISLKREIQYHELFFSSFGVGYQTSEAIRDKYVTEASFLYEVYLSCGNKGAEFVIVYVKSGEVRIDTVYSLLDSQSQTNPILAIDCCEHAFFLDYGFDKYAYLKRLIPYLNLSAIDKFLSYKD